MHLEIDPHGLPRPRRHVHGLLHPGLALATLLKDDVQDAAVAISDISGLRVALKSVSGTRQVPERQRAAASWNGELLVQCTVPIGLGSREAAKAIGRVAHECGINPAVRIEVADYGHCIVASNYPTG